MNGADIGTHAGVYWAVALLVCALVAAVSLLGWRLLRERRTARQEHRRLIRELSAAQARLESQRQELERTHAELAARAEQLEQRDTVLAARAEQLEHRGAVLAAVERDRDAKVAELARANRHLDAKTADLARANRDLDAQAAEIARANEHHAELLANLSNDLRTPLNSALILSKLLADNGSANLTPQQVRFARTIYSAGNDLLELLNDLLDLSKIEAGKLEIHRQPLAIAALVAALEQAVAPIAEQKRLDLAIRLAPDLPETLDSDAQRLAHVLKNLLATAIKLTDRGTVSLDINATPPGVEFTVRAADVTSGRSVTGTGLGLSLARELALLLGGRIEVQSEPPQASTFRFIVPAEARMMEHAPVRAGARG
jgi:signal transduction histidine kinase